MFSRRGNWVPFRPTGENWSSEQYCIWALLYEMNTEELEAKGENFIDNLQKVSRHLNKRAVYIINLEELIFWYVPDTKSWEFFLSCSEANGSSHNRGIWLRYSLVIATFRTNNNLDKFSFFSFLNRLLLRLRLFRLQTPMPFPCHAIRARFLDGVHIKKVTPKV